ncbi:MAG TPA: methylated-DNA--[protein]-cysteine S-methyltransferase, partial [Vicinamibacterales bacterium]
LPLDVQGTAFQRRVWKTLQRIPLGKTRSYGEIARAIGQPGAARAVARACASNHAALVIPCHRVVQGTGAPGGYHWGPKRKERLLAIEQALSAGAPAAVRAAAGVEYSETHAHGDGGAESLLSRRRGEGLGYTP